MKNIIYEIECGHAAYAPATLVSGKLFCPWHRNMQIITGVVVYEWRAKCDACNFSRWSGASKANAELFATGHYRRTREHRVYAEYTKNPEAVKTLEKFRAWHARN